MSPTVRVAALTVGLAVVLTAAACGDPTVQSAAPNVFIDQPSDTLGFFQGESITFRGHAVDPEDGPLPSGSLGWFSDVDGALGVGSQIVVSDLSSAWHRITLLAEDSDGVLGSASIRIVVQPAPASVIER
ncbi:MAG: hypothetical protein R3314_10255 [Longimicrobiales bacterium]|nr:hypothetical protein [Longimicrobiales bacterium]